MHCRRCNMARNSEKGENEKCTLQDLNLWQETIKNVENETQTVFDLEYGEIHSKSWKMTNMHCRRCNMARNSEQGENEKCTLQDLEYGEKSVNDGK